jgi:hypothetical protein
MGEIELLCFLCASVFPIILKHRGTEKTKEGNLTYLVPVSLFNLLSLSRCLIFVVNSDKKRDDENGSI